MSVCSFKEEIHLHFPEAVPIVFYEILSTTNVHLNVLYPSHIHLRSVFLPYYEMSVSHMRKHQSNERTSIFFTLMNTHIYGWKYIYIYIATAKFICYQIGPLLFWYPDGNDNHALRED